MSLDIGTVLFCVGLVGLVLVIFSWTQALIPGAPNWRMVGALGNTALAGGVGLYLTQGTLSPWISVILANGLVILGYHLLELSLRQFAQKRTSVVVVLGLIAAFFLTFIPFTFVWDLYSVRVAVYSVLVVGVWVRIMILLPQLSEYQRHRGMVRSFMILCAVILVSQGARGVIAIAEHGQSLLAPSQSLATMLLISILVIVAWTLGFITLELFRFRRHLEEALETRDRMIQLIAHDLRGPLGGQVGLLEMMREDGRCTDDEGEKLDQLTVSARKSYDLLENLLDWAQNQRGTIQLVPENLSARSLFEEAVEPYQTAAQIKAITVTFDTDPSFVRADRRTLTAILRNLVSNAVKFTPQNGRIRLVFRQTSRDSTFSVEDSGKGMAPELLARINHGQALPSTSGTKNEVGSGLGLSLCLDLARLNKGYLRFISGDSGTTALLIIPQPRSANPPV